MEIALPPDLERTLTAQAHRQGTTPERLVLTSLRETLTPIEGEPAAEHSTLADFLGEHIGVLQSSEHVSGGARMSEHTGDKFAKGMLRKRKEGQL